MSPALTNIFTKIASLKTEIAAIKTDDLSPQDNQALIRLWEFFYVYCSPFLEEHRVNHETARDVLNQYQDYLDRNR